MWGKTGIPLRGSLRACEVVKNITLVLLPMNMLLSSMSEADSRRPMNDSSKPRDADSNQKHQPSLDGYELNATAIAVLAVLRRHIPEPEVSGVVTNETLVKKVGRSVRSVQMALAKLVSNGLIAREKVDPLAEISPVRTVLLDPPRADKVIKGVRKLKKIQRRAPGERADPKQSRPYEQRYPFAYLHDPARFQALGVSTAIAEGLAYWGWLSEALGFVGHKLKLEFVAQKRRKSDGQRGGIVPNVSRREFVGEGTIPTLGRFADYLESKQMEGTFRVSQDSHPLLLVDDVAPTDLPRLPSAAAILETSPGNFQATLVAPRMLSRDEVLAVQTALIESVMGDVGANGSSQLRRFPGSINNKASLDRAFATRVYRIPESFVLSIDELDELLRVGTQKRLYMPSSRSTPQPDSRALPHRSTEANRQRLPSPTGIDTSPSGKDFGLAIELLLKGVSKTEVIARVAERAGTRQKRGRGLGDEMHTQYAKRTVERALERLNQWKRLPVSRGSTNTFAPTRQ